MCTRGSWSSYFMPSSAMVGWVAPLVYIADRELFFHDVCGVNSLARCKHVATCRISGYKSTTLGWVALLVYIADIIVCTTELSFSSVCVYSYICCFIYVCHTCIGQCNNID